MEFDRVADTACRTASVPATVSQTRIRCKLFDFSPFDFGDSLGGSLFDILADIKDNPLRFPLFLFAVRSPVIFLLLSFAHINTNNPDLRRGFLTKSLINNLETATRRSLPMGNHRIDYFDNLQIFLNISRLS